MTNLKTLIFTTIIIFFGLCSVTAQDNPPTVGWSFRTNSGNTDYHHFTRNKAGSAAVYINQVSTGPILRLSSGTATANQGVKFTFESNGYLGIGADIVTEKLVLYKADGTPVKTQYGNLSTGISATDGFVVGIESLGNGIIWNRENTFIKFGTNSAERMRIHEDGLIDIYGNIQSNGYKTIENNTDYHHFTRNNSGGAAVYINQVSSGPILRLSSGTETANQGVRFTVANNGAVGIGTLTLEDYMLSVNGKIRAKQIKVETGWSDFVFEEDYNLRSIKDVESFIKKNQHLPDIPSAKEVEENGVNLGEMDSKLLQKIEELTLYIIEQNKRIEKLERKLEGNDIK
ncbi:hypothetical protein R9C00_11375 [Flammeovirgaceae bacterium SG7u.111]|nr:hypothetical protein [Flammeovirgaceae bacterium SG7u.132]WPO38052.1 hypothetical protein R9C00_11375 [Flammeovirgaceae bacterium SG7u.111]